MAKVLWVRLLSIGQLKLFQMSVWVKCRGFLTGLFQIFHLISTNMLTDLPEILFYNCPYLALFSVQIVVLLHNWVQSCVEICLNASQKTFTKLYNMVTQRNYSFMKRFLGFTQNNRGHYSFSINCWMMSVWKHPHQKLATFLKHQKFNALVLWAV